MSVKERMDREYNQLYGEIPNNQLDRIKFILGKHAYDSSYSNNVEKLVKKIKKIKTKTVEFTMWTVVRPSARPRVNTRRGYMHMYVPRADLYASFFEEFCKENNFPYIETPCELNMRFYEKTPSSFNKMKKVLAELGYIRPWKRTGDFDNYAKTIGDCIQHGMLKDDCLVIDSKIELYYSLKPHVDISIKYLDCNPEDILQKGKK